MTHTRTSRSNGATALAWTPLAIVLLLLAASAAGYGGQLVPDAGAAATESVTVTGELTKDVQLDGSSCIGSALVVGTGTISQGDPMVQSTTDCTISFSTNNSPLGADLTIAEDPAAGSGHAMKCTGGSCSGDALDDFSGADWNGVTGSNFGTQIMSVGSGTSAMQAVNPATHAVAAPMLACQTSSTALGTCNFRFAASADTTNDDPGNYQAVVQFVAQAR